MDRSITSLPLSSESIDLLQKAGFVSVESLFNLRPTELSREVGCSHEEAVSILKSIQPTDKQITIANIPNAKDYLTRRDIGRSIITFSKSLDMMMGGGVPVGQITELAGVPGIGKSQLAMQLSVDVQIPETFGGNGAETVYIDTEGSFSVERVGHMAEALSTHLEKLAKTRAAQHPATAIEVCSTAAGMTRDRFLEGIHVFRVHEQAELLAVIAQLPAFLKTHTRVRLIVLDSIAFHFRQTVQDAAKRGRILSGLSQALNQMAFECSLAVVITNHVTTRFSGPNTSGAIESMEGSFPSSSAGTSSSVSSVIAPALGDLWAHCVTNRVLLFWGTKETAESGTSQVRMAEIVKSPCWPMGSACFSIVAAGVRDLPSGRKARDGPNGTDDRRSRPRLT